MDLINFYIIYLLVSDFPFPFDEIKLVPKEEVNHKITMRNATWAGNKEGRLFSQA